MPRGLVSSLSLLGLLCVGCAGAPQVEVEHLQTLGEAELHHDALIFDLALSPGGARILAASSVSWAGGPGSAGALALWDAESGEKVRTLVQGDHEVVSAGFFKSSSIGTHAASCAFSPSGKRVAAALSTNEVRVWDAQSGEQLASFPGAGPVRFRDEGHLVCGRSPAGGELQEIDLKSETAKHLFSLGDNLWGLAVGEGGVVAAGSHDGHVHLWPGKGEPFLLEQSDTSRPVEALAFRPGSQTLAASSRAGVELWDLKTRRRIGLVPSGSLKVTALAWSSEGERLAYAVHGSKRGTYRGVIHVVELDAQGRAQGEAMELRGHGDEVSALAFRGGELVSAGYDNTIRRWSLESGAEVPTHPGHRGVLFGVAWLPEGAGLASVAEDGRVLAWSPEGKARELHALGQPGQGLVQAQGHLATVTRDEGRVVVVPVQGGAPLEVDLRRGESFVGALGRDAKGALLTRNLRGETFAWGLPEGHEQGYAPGNDWASLHAPLVVSCGDAVLLCDESNSLAPTQSRLQVRELAQLDREPLLECLVMGSVTGIACDPRAGRAFACTGQGACEAISLETGKSLWRVEVPQSFALALSPKGDFLVLGHDNGDAPSVLDAATGELIGNLPPCHGGVVRGLSFAPDGRLASWGNDNRIQLWRITRRP